MPIDVLCPGCKSRFQVNEKFAGKKGPCPKCKQVLTVPAVQVEVKIHAPEEGPKDAKGRPVLKPITREETKVTKPLLIGIIGTIVLVLVGALFVRINFKQPKKNADVPVMILALGAILLAPPLSMAAYSFLRDADLEPYTGMQLYARVAITAAVYSLLWLLYFAVKVSWLGGKPPEIFALIFIVPVIFSIGGLAGNLSFDLGFGNGVVHFGLYLLVTVLLRLIVGLPAF